jgi:hypothetical protein
MSAGCVCEFEDSSTVSIISAVLSGDDLSVGGCVVVDGAFGVASGDEFGSLGEVDGELRREGRRGLDENEA